MYNREGLSTEEGGEETEREGRGGVGGERGGFAAGITRERNNCQQTKTKSKAVLTAVGHAFSLKLMLLIIDDK